MNISARQKYLLPIIPLLLAGGIVALFFINSSYRPQGVHTQANICDFFVATTGTPAGDGSSNNPWDLQTALNHPVPVSSGKTICLRGGTYRGVYESKLIGVAGNPIVVRSVPGEWAVIDANQNAIIAADITSSSTTVTLSGGSHLPDPVNIMVDGEVIRLAGKNAPNIYRINSRAWSGTTAVDHVSGAPVLVYQNTLEVNGSDTIYRDFEVTSSRTQRTLNTTGSNAVDFNQRFVGINVQGPRTKFINLFIHDTGEGIGFRTNAVDSEVYGSIIYNNGVEAPDRGHGHGIYTQNANGTKTISDNIIFGNFGGYNLHVYGSSAATLRGYLLKNNVLFANRTLIGGNAAATEITADGNYLYGTGLEFGYGNQSNGSATVVNNYVYAPIPLSLFWWDSASINNNSFYQNASGSGASMVVRLPADATALSRYVINNNKYIYGKSFMDKPFYVYNPPATGGSTLYDFAGWNGLGFDSASTFQGATSTNTTIVKPTGTDIFYQPNKYEAGRANVVVYNYDKAASVNVDLSKTGLLSGQQFEIRNGQNYSAAPLASGTYSGQTVSVNLSNAKIAQPIGDAGINNSETCPEFCVFVVVPVVTGATSTPSNPTPPSTPAPTISSFTASPTSITSGASTTLSWNVSNATSLSINQNIGTVTGTSQSVSPTATTTYTLTATNSTGVVTADVVVNVDEDVLISAVGSCTGSNCINVNSSQTYQTIDGWEATSQSGHEDANTFNTYKNNLFDQAVNDLGINRIRLEIRSGAENPTDYWTMMRNGQITNTEWKAKRYEIINDDANASSVTAPGYNWSDFDYRIDQVVNPLRQKMQARGEKLYVNVNYVDFGSSTFEHKSNPAEYAEFVLATYQHMQSKYGFTPDYWEVILEPDTTSAGWTAAQVGNAIKAAGDRLVAAGFTPRFIAPSTMNGLEILPTAQGGNNWVGKIAAVTGAMQYVHTISYHRYTSPSQAQTQNIGLLGAQYGKKTAMLEKIAADYNNLHMDLKYGNNSAWQQYTLAYPKTTDDGGSYYNVNDTNGTFTLGLRSKLLRQYFKYIRYGAVRIEAGNSGNPFIDPVAFRNTDGKHVVVTPVTGTTSFGINGLPSGTYGIFYTTTGGVTTNLSNQTISAGESVSLTNIPAGVVTIYATTGSSNPTPPSTPAPTISSFTASPTSITSGGSTTLSWNVSNATSLSINQSVGTVTGTSRTVSPTATTTYTLTATNSTGVVTASVTVNVIQPGDTSAPSVSITSPTAGSTISGNSVSLTANASDNVGVAGVQFRVNGVNVGSEDTTFPYSYSLNSTLLANGTNLITAVARDAAGNTTTSSSVSVTVNNVIATPPAIASFTASPTSITSGASTTLSWNVTGATSLSINQSVGAVTGTSRTVSPTTTTTYTLTATNSTGVTTATVTVVVVQPGDVTGPTISNISVIQSEFEVKKVRAVWTTNELSTTQVEWGTTTAYGNTSSLDNNFVTTHQAVISNLAPQTTYHYRVKSRDAAGNLTTSADQTFTTRSRYTKPPKPQSLTFTSGSIILNWGGYQYDLCTAIEIHRSNTTSPSIPTSQTLIASLPCTDVSYHDENVTPGITYYYSIFTKDDVGVYSEPLSGSFVAPGNPTVPVGNTGGGSSGGGGGGGSTKPKPTTPSPTNNSSSSVVLPVNVTAGQVIKFGNNPTVYLVQSTGLHPFDSYASLQDYMGKTGAVVSVKSGTATTYTVSVKTASAILNQTPGNPTTGQLPQDGTNFSCSGNPTVYYYSKGQKQAYSEAVVFEAWNGKNYSSIQIMPASVCQTVPGSSLARLPENSYIKVTGGTEIYRIEGTSARPYTNYPAFLRDSSGKAVYTISLNYLHTYSRGANLE